MACLHHALTNGCLLGAEQLKQALAGQVHEAPCSLWAQKWGPHWREAAGRFPLQQEGFASACRKVATEKRSCCQDTDMLGHHTAAQHQRRCAGNSRRTCLRRQTEWPRCCTPLLACEALAAGSARAHLRAVHQAHRQSPAGVRPRCKEAGQVGCEQGLQHAHTADADSKRPHLLGCIALGLSTEILLRRLTRSSGTPAEQPGMDALFIPAGSIWQTSMTCLGGYECRPQPVLRHHLDVEPKLAPWSSSFLNDLMSADWSAQQCLALTFQDCSRLIYSNSGSPRSKAALRAGLS